MAKARSNGRREFSVPSLAGAVAVLLISAPLLAACGSSGFQPLYGSASVGGPGVSQKLAQVDIGHVPGRVGQQLRNELIYQSTGGGGQQEPLYRLDIAIRETLSSTLVRTDGDARSQIYNLDASFKLVRLSDKSVVLEGKSYQRAAFERYTSVFSNVRAREDAENRAAKTMGEELKTRIAAYLASTA
ncbi:MAG: LPS assembly lipoprotein LptE [Hyphomicrobium sp.]|nr:LPS assembly lipoprotein LptE [Hyphomicrobium sp.]